MILDRIDAQHYCIVHFHTRIRAGVIYATFACLIFVVVVFVGGGENKKRTKIYNRI
jgi:hypothetical protein